MLLRQPKKYILLSVTAAIDEEGLLFNDNEGKRHITTAYLFIEKPILS